jgi:hypothetical protein
MKEQQIRKNGTRRRSLKRLRGEARNATKSSVEIPRSMILIGYRDIRGPFEKFVDWRQYAAVMQREA